MNSFDDKAGFGLTKTLNILANTKEYTHNPIECSKVRESGRSEL